MQYSKILNQIIVLFLIMVVGFYARKKNIINKEVNRGLSSLLLNITLPFMIFASFNIAFNKDMLINGGKLLIYSTSIYLFAILISKLLYFKYPKDKKSILRFVTIFSNCGFMGFPVIESVYGKTGVFYTSIFNISFNILIWVVGIILLTGEFNLKTLKEVMLNPGIIATFLGLAVFIFSIKLPLPIYKTFDLVGSITTPIAMLVVGAMLADIKIMDVFCDISLYYGTAVRLIVMPLIVLVVMKWLGVKDMFLGISVLITAMPAPANAAIMAEMYGGDASFASKCIFLSTVLSAITIPLIIKLM